ncbi:Uncharacterized protein SCF082_LOCUS31634 [Durusdinium trenchii]|uniref:DUF7869 domain-containing protein n=1 Tax=Durusdinium trenchii TaxID=1381693 RepID=A0ABP0N9V7_9DINO
MCESAFCMLLGVNEKRVRRLKLGLGTNNVPVDRRKYNGKVPGEKASSVDSFFSYCYWNMAEPLAETEAVEEVTGAALCASGLFLPRAVDSDLPANLLDNTIAPSHSAQTFAQVNAVAAVEMMAPGNKALGGHEVVEIYFITPPDLPKDSSTELTCLFRALDMAHEILTARGLDFPQEGKNQIVAKASASAIISGRFRSVTHTFGEVGHTHSCVDQRLSIVTSAFTNTDVIQEPQDFVDIIKAKVQPSRRRELRAEVLEGAHNWQKYYDQYGVSISGLDLPLYDDKSGDSWSPTEIPDEVYNCSETDCVLLVKQLVNSESLSQPPTVCLPGDFGKRLKAPLEGLPRNLVSDRAKKEWHRFAPGPVRAVIVEKAKPKPAPGPKGEPKRRGRKRKSEVEGESGDARGAEEIFDGRSNVARISPPPPPGPDESLFEVEESAEPIPTRATFAGRSRPKAEQGQRDFDQRRQMYYSMVPSSFWKDHFERQYWVKCSQCPTIDDAIASFLDDIGVKPQPPSSRPAARAPKAQAKGKAAAKPKAKANPGRGRSRGRGRGCGRGLPVR